MNVLNNPITDTLSGFYSPESNTYCAFLALKGLFFMKKFIAVTAFVFMLLFSVNCFAAPSSVAMNDAGNISGLVIVKKPETPVSSTTKKVYTVSALSIEGVEISLYKYNPSTGNFDVLYDASGAPVVNTVGATGIYVRDIALDPNTNYLLVRAGYGGYYQTIRFDITLLDQGLLDSINGFATNFMSVFGGW